jgi:hypothetical protein
MAFDTSTRNRLQKFVSLARSILSEEFTRQLQATYGMDPKTGSISDVESLSHLDNRQRQVAETLRETFTYYLDNTPGKSIADRTVQVYGPNGSRAGLYRTQSPRCLANG